MSNIAKFHESNKAALKGLYDLPLYARQLRDDGLFGECAQLYVLAEEIQGGVYGMEAAFNERVQDGLDDANKQMALALQAVLNTKREEK